MNKKPTTQPRNSQRQNLAKKPVPQKVNFVRGQSSEQEKAKFENMSNVEFVQRNRSNVANSTASTSRAPQPKYVRNHVDRRTCFACGEIGHVSYKCPNSSNAKRFQDTQFTPSSRVKSTPKVKVDLESKSQSVCSKEKEQDVAKLKKAQFAKDRDYFDICDPMSSIIFDQRENLIKKYPQFRQMHFEDVENFIKQSMFSNSKKSRSKAKPKASPPKVEKVVLPYNVYQKKPLSRQQVWRPKETTSCSKNEGCERKSPSPSGEWVNVIRHDTQGKPKTVRAWVPTAN